MLTRLEVERRDAARRIVDAHESERLRIAQELHDEVGQTLTAVLLQLSRLEQRLPDNLSGELSEAQESARASLEDVRRIATDLRPEALRDLGLASALAALGDGFGRRVGLHVDRQIQTPMPQLSSEAELAVYPNRPRGATNVARHAGSDTAELTVASDADQLTLTVRDHGRGLPNGLRNRRQRNAGNAGASGTHRRQSQDRNTNGRIRDRAASRTAAGRYAVPDLKTRILLADDHNLVRRGLRLILDAQPDLEVVAEADDGAEAVKLALSADVELAIFDISMPRMTGLQAARELQQRRPDLPILILSMHESEQYLYEALRAGASGYVVKRAADRDLVEACRATDPG